jgi:hypothetical protein
VVLSALALSGTAAPHDPIVVTLQNGRNGYSGQENTHMNWGGWSYDDNLAGDCSDDIAGTYPGFDTPGLGPSTSGLDDLDYDNGGFTANFCENPPEPRFHSRNLVAFRGLENQLPAGFQVGSAQLILNQVFQRDDGTGIPTTFDVYEALMPWDSNTFWTGWGNGGMDAGFEGAQLDSISWDVAGQNAALAASPGGVGGDNASGSIFVTFDLPAATVQNWIDNPSSNRGRVIRTPVGAQTSAFTFGGENGPGDGAGDPPMLLLTPVAAPGRIGDFSSISISSGSTANLDFTGDANTDYQLQTLPDPGSGTWSVEGTPQTSDGSGNVSFSAPVVGSGAAFRAEEQ